MIGELGYARVQETKGVGESLKKLKTHDVYCGSQEKKNIEMVEEL